MTHVSYDDPSSLRTLLACTIVVLLLLRRKNKQRSNPLFHQRLTWDKFVEEKPRPSRIPSFATNGH